MPVIPSVTSEVFCDVKGQITSKSLWSSEGLVLQIATCSSFLHMECPALQSYSPINYLLSPSQYFFFTSTESTQFLGRGQHFWVPDRRFAWATHLCSCKTPPAIPAKMSKIQEDEIEELAQFLRLQLSQRSFVVTSKSSSYQESIARWSSEAEKRAVCGRLSQLTGS